MINKFPLTRKSQNEADGKLFSSLLLFTLCFDLAANDSRVGQVVSYDQPPVRRRLQNHNYWQVF